jgi:hypothetical protein
MLVLSILTLAGTVSMHVLPSIDLSFAAESTEFFDIEESENGEQEKEKKEFEDEKKYSSRALVALMRSHYSASAQFCFDHGIPAPPCIETMSPPPDQA